MKYLRSKIRNAMRITKATDTDHYLLWTVESVEQGMMLPAFEKVSRREVVEVGLLKKIEGAK